jgi:hypothetical protein
MREHLWLTVRDGCVLSLQRDQATSFRTFARGKFCRAIKCFGADYSRLN